MKSFKSIVLALLFGALLSLAACGGSQQHSHDGDHDHDHDTEATSEHAHGEGANYTSAYVCPMHCEGSGSEEPGKCPVCGMSYVDQKEHIKDGHTH